MAFLFLTHPPPSLEEWWQRVCAFSVVIISDKEFAGALTERTSLQFDKKRFEFPQIENVGTAIYGWGWR